MESTCWNDLQFSVLRENILLRMTSTKNSTQDNRTVSVNMMRGCLLLDIVLHQPATKTFKPRFTARRNSIVEWGRSSLILVQLDAVNVPFADPGTKASIPTVVSFLEFLTVSESAHSEQELNYMTAVGLGSAVGWCKNAVVSKEKPSSWSREWCQRKGVQTCTEVFCV